MTVKELMELLSKMDQNSTVCIYNYELESNDPVNSVEEIKTPGESIVQFS